MSLISYFTELDRRMRRSSFGVERICFGIQQRVCKSKTRRKVLRCGRRAGKTFTIVVKSLDLSANAAAKEGKRVLYLTITRANAKEIAWEDLIRLNEEHGLGGTANIAELSMSFPNGGLIQLRGVNTEKEIAKVRGKKFHLVVVDEAQSIPDRILKPLITAVINPALLDYRGELWLVGTPPPVRAGYFWECYNGKLKDNYEQFRWTILDNTELPAVKDGHDIQDILREIREDNGWDENDPTYRREILGEDVEDHGILLYEFSKDRNEAPLPVGGTWRYVFGVDIGFDDSDAIAVLGWQVGIPKLWLIEEHIHSGEDLVDLADRLTPLIEKYRPLTIAIDQGGAKKAVVTLQRRFALPLTPAEKAQKGDHIKLLNAELRKARIMAKPGSAWAEDCKLVRKDPKALAEGKLQELKTKDGGWHSDICDAVLYGWRAAMHWVEKPAPLQPEAADPTLARFLKANQAKGPKFFTDEAKKFGFRCVAAFLDIVSGNYFALAPPQV